MWHTEEEKKKNLEGLELGPSAISIPGKSHGLIAALLDDQS